MNGTKLSEIGNGAYKVAEQAVILLEIQLAETVISHLDVKKLNVLTVLKF